MNQAVGYVFDSIPQHNTAWENPLHWENFIRHRKNCG